MKQWIALGLVALVLSGCQTPATTTQETTQTTINQPQKETISVTINISVDGKAIENSPFTLDVVKGTSLLEAMKDQLTIEEKDGFVTSINGHEQDANANKWWLFDYNGAMSEVGASEVQLQEGDVIDWKLEAYQP